MIIKKLLECKIIKKLLSAFCAFVNSYIQQYYIYDLCFFSLSDIEISEFFNILYYSRTYIRLSIHVLHIYIYISHDKKYSTQYSELHFLIHKNEKIVEAKNGHLNIFIYNDSSQKYLLSAMKISTCSYIH